MWAIVDKSWTAELTRWLGTRRVLEIMAGRGWLAKVLSEHRVAVAATDNFGWHGELPLVYPVQQKDAPLAAQDPEAEVLIVSWPHMDDSELLHQACLNWGTARPIVYIGENSGGCTADGRFWDHFRPLESAPKIVLPHYPGLSDELLIGHYARRC